MASTSVAYRFLERLQSAAEGIRTLIHDVYSQHGVNSTWVELLTFVSEAGETGCSQTELSRRLRLAESSVCGLVDKLQVAGLLHRFRSRQDRRRSLLLLSSAGRERLQAIHAAVDDTLLAWVADASDQELKQLNEWLDALLGNQRRLLRWAAVDGSDAAQRDEWSGESADPRLREAG